MDETGVWLLIALVCGGIWLFSTLKTAKKNKKVDEFRDAFDSERDDLIAKGQWDMLLFKLTQIATGIFASGNIFAAGNYHYMKKTLEDIVAYGEKCTATKIDVAAVKESLDLLVDVNEGKKVDVKVIKEKTASGTKIITDAYGELYAKFGA